MPTDVIAVSQRSRRRSIRIGPDVLLNPLVFGALGYGAVYGVRHPGATALVVIAAAGVCAGVFAWRRPVLTLIVVAVGMSFHTITLAWLYRRGFTPNVLTLAAYWKEWLLLVVAVRAWWEHSQSDRPADRVDLLAGAYLAVVAIYILLPLGPDLRTRYIGARTDAAFVVLFLAARWLRSTRRDRHNLERAVIVAGTIVAALGVWNYVDTTGWTTWVNGTGLVPYLTQVLKTTTYGPVLETAFGSGTVIRVGSIFLDPIALGYLMLVTIGVAGSRILRGVGTRLEYVASVICVVCTCMTFTRSAIALLPVLGLILAIGSGRLQHHIGLFVTGALALALFAGLVGVGDRVSSGFDTKDQRTASHIDALSDATGRIVSEPLGSGLGTVSGVSIRFNVEGSLPTTENFYLQLAGEVGIAGSAIFVAFTVALWQLLWRRARQDSSGVALGAAAGFGCVALGGIVLHTFANIPVTWPLLVLAGLALSPAESDVSTQANV